MTARIFFQSCTTAIAVVVLAAGAVCAQDAVRVSCLPDKAVARPDDTLKLQAWVSSASGLAATGPTAHWRTTEGRLDATGLTATWSLEGIPVERRQVATVDVSVEGQPVVSCSLGVWVEAPPPPTATGPRTRGEDVTRRAFLQPTEVGEAGFGLHSYFLMRRPADAGQRARADRFVRAFLDVLVGVAEQENYVERRRLNGSYLPVALVAPPGMSTTERVAWAIEHYDYDRAQRLLSLYPSLTGPGPFIIAVSAPLRSPVKPMLPWDFSQVQDDALAEGVGRFLNQAAQLYDWQNQSALQQLRDQLLTVVAGTFVGRTTAENMMQIVR